MFDKIKEYDADVQFEIGQRIQALRMSKEIAAVLKRADGGCGEYD
jgi:hypothetical protein